MVFSFQTGFRVYDVLKMEQAVVVKRYICTWFTFDATFLVCDVLFLAAILDRKVGLIRLARVLRIIRVWQTLRQLRSRLKNDLLKLKVDLAMLGLWSMMFFHISACVWLCIGNLTGGWTHHRMDWKHEGAWYMYIKAFNWVVTKGSSGAITPTNTYESQFAVFYNLAWLYLTSEIVNQVTAARLHVISIFDESARRRRQVGQYLADFNISSDVCRRVHSFLDSLPEYVAPQSCRDISELVLLPDRLCTQVHVEAR